MKKIFLLLFPLFLLAKESAILALSWMNSYCAINKTYECRHRSEFSYNNFTIHGLWPKKMNCSYSKLNLDRKFLKELQVYMPSKYLIKHEWKKHGSCFSKDPKEYFLTSIRLTKEFDDSLVNRFFYNNKGKRVTLQQVRYVFAKAFGKRNVRKFQLVCKNGYITEIRLKLYGDIKDDSLYDLLDEAYNLHRKQCQGGIIAP